MSRQHAPAAPNAYIGKKLIDIEDFPEWQVEFLNFASLPGYDVLYTTAETTGHIDVSEAVLPEFCLGAQRARINRELADIDPSLTGDDKLRAETA
jgi:hypothetical protein